MGALVQLRGRPLAPESIEDIRDDRRALLTEMRAARRIVPLAEYVRQRVAIDCDPLAEQAQARVVVFLESMARKGGGDAA